MTCAPGMVLEDTYRILAVLGKGGSGTVYLARHMRGGRLWAVKEIQGTKSRLIMEAELLKRLRHPGLPAVGDVLEAEGMLYLVMDYIEGKSLKQILDEEGPQSEARAADWARQLCRVLAYLHGRSPPVIYRDLKPSNIMVRPDGRIVLVDFGTAREQKNEAGGDTLCLGTRGYAAPEQYGGNGQTGPETDIYGLGAVLYHVLTGKSPAEPPYGGQPLRRLRPELSEGMEQIVSVCMQADRRERYLSCEAFLEALDHSERLGAAYRRRKRRRRQAAAAAAVLLAAAGTAGGIREQVRRAEQKAAYEASLEEAAGTAGREAREEILCDAAKMQPRREEAYQELLKSFLEDDGVFSVDEELKWKALLWTDTGGTSCLEQLEGNRTAYVRVSYQTGLLYFYYYGGSGGRQASVRWFRAAEKAEPEVQLPAHAVYRSGILARIADYYELLDVEKRTGDAGISYEDYWSDLVSLTEEELIHKDNLVTALVVYREAVWQMARRAGAFREAGVTGEEMEAQVRTIREALANLKEREPERSGYEEQMLAEAEEGAEAAMKAVQAACQNNVWEKGDVRK